MVFLAQKPYQPGQTAKMTYYNDIARAYINQCTAFWMTVSIIYFEIARMELFSWFRMT